MWEGYVNPEAACFSHFRRLLSHFMVTAFLLVPLKNNYFFFLFKMVFPLENLRMRWGYDSMTTWLGLNHT